MTQMMEFCAQDFKAAIARMGFPGGGSSWNLPAMQEMLKRCRFDPQVGKIPQSRKWQPAPVLLPGKFHGQRSLVGYSPWGHKESDTTERLSSKKASVNRYKEPYGKWASQVAQLVKNPPAMQETPFQFLGQKGPLEKG